MSNINYFKACILFLVGIICVVGFCFVCDANVKGTVLLSEDFQSSEIEKHFATNWLNGLNEQIDGMYVSDIDYDYLNNLIADINFGNYQSYVICDNGNSNIIIYLFSCDGSLAYSQSSYGDFCKFIYSKDVENAVYRRIILDNGNITDDGERTIPRSDNNESYYCWDADFGYCDLISTSCAVYDCVELVENWNQNTFPYYFNWDCLTRGTNLNRYVNLVADDAPVETINNHMYMLSCDVGFCGNVVQGDMGGFNSTYVYFDYTLDKYAKAHAEDYLLHVNYYLYVDGRKYEYLYVTGVTASEYFIQPLSDIKFTADIWSGSNITAQAKSGTFLEYQKQNLVLLDTSKSCELVVSCYISGTTASLSSGQFVKRFNLANGQSTITDYSITDNNNPYTDDVGLGGSVGSAPGGGVASIMNNPSFSPVFNNNNNITIEGDKIDNDVNNIIENDDTSKEDNDSFIDKFLGFFNLLDNNSFLSVLTKVFGWLPATVFTVLTSAIGIICGIAVIKFFRK